MSETHIRAGVWKIDLVEGVEIVILLRPDRGGILDTVRTLYEAYRWERIINPGEQGLFGRIEISRGTIDNGEDITNSFMADPDNVDLLARNFPDGLVGILTDRPEICVPKSVIQMWNTSPVKQARILAIKYLSRVDRGSESLDKSKTPAKRGV